MELFGCVGVKHPFFPEREDRVAGDGAAESGEGLYQKVYRQPKPGLLTLNSSQKFSSSFLPCAVHLSVWHGSLFIVFLLPLSIKLNSMTRDWKTWMKKEGSSFLVLGKETISHLQPWPRAYFPCL